MVIGSLFLVIWRKDSLKTEARLDSLISREAVFLFQNLLLVALTAVIFWITFFPLISEAITGTEISVGPPAFRPFVVPLAIIIVLLSGIGPIIAWRRVTVAKLRRSFTFPAVVALVVLAVLVAFGSIGPHVFALLMFGAGAFVIAAVAQEFYRGVRARQAMTSESPPVALGRLVRRNRRRYGGYIVHAGVAFALIGVAASTSFQDSRTATIRPGQSVMIHGYKVRYVRATASADVGEALVRRRARGHEERPSRHDAAHLVRPVSVAGPDPGADRAVLRRLDREPGRSPGRDHPGHLGGDQPEHHAAARADHARGRCVLQKALNARARAAAGGTRKGAQPVLFQLRDLAIRELTQRFVTHPWAATFLLIVSPLVTWLWLGAIMAALGGLIALWPLPLPRRRRRAVPPRSDGARRGARGPRTRARLIRWRS